MATTTSRLALAQPAGADPPLELRTAISGNATILDAATTFVSNTLVNLSSSLAGQLLRATDTKQWFVDNGTTLDRLLTLGLAPLTYLSAPSSATAVAGQWLNAAAGITVTLPSPAVTNSTLAIKAAAAVTGASPVTITTGTGAIYGGGVNGATSISLGTTGAYVLLQADGTNWIIVSGQQDTGWVALTLGTNITAPANFYTAAIRLVGDTVRLTGGLHNNSGGSLGTNSTVATFASATFLPAQGVNLAANTGVSGAAAIYIHPPTQSLVNSYSINTSDNIYLDGLTYRIS